MEKAEQKVAREKKARDLSSCTRIKLLGGNFTEEERAVSSLCSNGFDACNLLLSVLGHKAENGNLAIKLFFKRSVFIKISLLYFRHLVSLVFFFFF